MKEKIRKNGLHLLSLPYKIKFRIRHTMVSIHANEPGVYFTFGIQNTNGQETGKMEYLIEAINECVLKASDRSIRVIKKF